MVTRMRLMAAFGALAVAVIVLWQSPPPSLGG